MEAYLLLEAIDFVNPLNESTVAIPNKDEGLSGTGEMFRQVPKCTE